MEVHGQVISYLDVITVLATELVFKVWVQSGKILSAIRQVLICVGNLKIVVWIELLFSGSFKRLYLINTGQSFCVDWGRWILKVKVTITAIARASFCPVSVAISLDQGTSSTA